MKNSETILSAIITRMINLKVFNIIEHLNIICQIYSKLRIKLIQIEFRNKRLYYLKKMLDIIRKSDNFFLHYFLYQVTIFC